MNNNSAQEKNNKSFLKKFFKPRNLKFLVNIFLISVIIFSFLFIISKKFNILNFSTLLSSQPETSQQKSPSKTSPTPIKTPRPLPHGKQNFSVRGGIQNAPTFEKGQLDPIDPKQNTEQKISIYAENFVPIDSIEATVKTDNKKSPIKMKLTEGTETAGTWMGAWTVDDTYLQRYQIKIVAKASNGNQEVELTLR